ncbi:hypothetical protein BC826DRAFT_239954 [Russula brevipes]|nr:hypothetical protein BC826DRAFT_239954 [Russula brevipes]
MCQAFDAFNTRWAESRLLNTHPHAHTDSSPQLANISLCCLAQYHYSPTAIVMCGLHRVTNSSPVTLSRRRILVVLAPLCVYFLLLSYVPLPVGLVSSGQSNTFTLSQHATTCLVLSS